MNAVVTVRNYLDSDLTAVIAIAQDLQRHELHYFDRLKPTEAIGESYISYLLAEVKSHDGQFLVAEVSGEIAGYATLLTQFDSSKDFEEVFYTYSYIGDLAVKQSARRAGVGKALIASCENTVRSARIKFLRLAVLADNNDARSFYAKAGYSELLIRLEKTL